MTAARFPDKRLLETARVRGALRILGCAALAACLVASARAADRVAARAEPSESFLDSLKDETILASTIPDNGDLNPYAVVVAPVSTGVIQRGDVLVSNWNNSSNLQGLGTTIVDLHPGAHKSILFATVPRHLDGCPGGVGMSTSMTMLKAGYVLVGSLPSNDGTANTVGKGCLVVFDSRGRFVKTLVGPEIDSPWSNMVIVDRGATATVFVTMLGQGAHHAEDDGSKQANVVRLSLAVTAAGPVVTGETVVASGFQVKPDKDVLIIGPTGLALDGHGTLYVSDANDNRIVAIADALSRKTSAGTGREITKDGLLKRPLAMALTPGGHLLALNGQDGRVVEIESTSGQQLVARWINTNKAQTPPGNGNLFGLAMTLDGTGFYYVNDDVNQLALSR